MKIIDTISTSNVLLYYLEDHVFEYKINGPILDLPCKYCNIKYCMSLLLNNEENKCLTNEEKLIKDIIE